MRLFGVHVVGEQATELVHLGLIAMMAEAGADLFNRTCFNYPTLGHLIGRDLCGDAETRRTGRGRQRTVANTDFCFVMNELSQPTASRLHCGHR